MKKQSRFSNPVRIEGKVAFIGLRNRRGEVVAETMIDVGDLPILEKYGRTWALAEGYAMHSNSTIKMHRLITNFQFSLVDHRDENKLNNRRENLRGLTHSGNRRNQSRPRVTSKSGTLGVYWVKNARKWRSQIKTDEQKIHLGYFDNLEDAGAAYRAAKAKYHTDWNLASVVPNLKQLPHVDEIKPFTEDQYAVMETRLLNHASGDD